MYIKRSILTNNAKALARTNGRFGDIYRIILPESDSVMCETSTTLRIHRITYREARDKIESLAKGIVARFGANDRYIALYGENSPEWIMLFWAILRSGNRAYLINTRQPDYFTESVLSTLDAVGIVSLHGASGLSFCAEASVAELFELAKESVALDDDAPFGNEIAITTSGTTLREKICIYHGENFSKQLLMTPEVTDDNKTLRATYNGHHRQDPLMLTAVEAYSFVALLFITCPCHRSPAFPNKILRPQNGQQGNPLLPMQCLS